MLESSIEIVAKKGLRFLKESLLGFHGRLSVSLHEDCHLLLFAIYLDLGRGGVAEYRRTIF